MSGNPKVRKGQNEKRHRRDDGGGADHRDDRRSFDTDPGKTGLLTGSQSPNDCLFSKFIRPFMSAQTVKPNTRFKAGF